MSPYDAFKAQLCGPRLPERLQASLIGDKVMVPGSQGPRPMLYADYVASGRGLRLIEDFVADHVLPTYANTHTETSYFGAATTALREGARAEIARILGAGPDAHVIFSGAGATSCLNRVVGLLNIRPGSGAVVLHGPYEHHSNILPWRESGADVVEIPEDPVRGGPDMAALKAALDAHRDAPLLVGTFSAMSNVTGIVTDPDPVTRLLKAHGALAIWDYAGGAPYLAMSMGQGDTAKDAIIFSAHKFPGGPQASGVLVVCDSVIRRATPTQPGGGTVAFVSPWDHQYILNVVAREESGTPNVIGDIRAGLVLLVKEALGQDWIDARHEDLRARAQRAWSGNDRIEVLGHPDAVTPLPIFSFRIRDGAGGHLDHNRFTTALSDLYGIQARGGCSCAGPYGHRLLDFSRAESEAAVTALREGREFVKPGWVRVNLSYLLSDEKADAILAGIDALSHQPDLIATSAPA